MSDPVSLCFHLSSADCRFSFASSFCPRGLRAGGLKWTRVSLPYRVLILSYKLSLVFSPLLSHAPFGWWAQVDSNHRPRAYQARALTC